MTIEPINLSYTLVDEAKLEKKPYIFFIHGAQSNGNTWNTTLEGLKDKYRIVVVNLRGHGKSPLGKGQFTLEDLVLDIKCLVDKLNLVGKIIVVAHSMGSRIANFFASKYPSYLLGLVIEDLGLQALNDLIIHSSDERVQKFKNFPQDYKTFEDAQDALAECGYDATRTLSWLEDGRITHNQESDTYHVSLRPYVSYLSFKNILAYRDTAFEKIDPSLPMLFMGAEKVDYFPIKERENMQTIRPTIKRFDVPNSDHSIHKSNTTAFLKILNEFIDGIEFPSKPL